MAPTPTPVPPLPPVPMTDEWLSPIDRIAAALEEMRDGSPLTGQPRANLDQLLAEAYSGGINWTAVLGGAALIVAVVALALVLRHRHVAVTNPTAFALSQPVVDDESIQLAIAVSKENRMRLGAGLPPLPEPALPVTIEGGDPR